MKVKRETQETAWEIQPLTPERWADFEELFGPHGAIGGCWCMWFRLTQKEFDARKGERNRKAMKAIVNSSRVPGILAYHQGHAVGWCSVAPREEFARLERSRLLKPVDGQRVWSVVCFFVAKEYRRKGVAKGLLKAAVEYVNKQGGSILEGYAVEPKAGKMPDLFAYHGPASLYKSVGFKEVARRSKTRPMMRFLVVKK